MRKWIESEKVVSSQSPMYYINISEMFLSEEMKTNKRRNK